MKAIKLAIFNYKENVHDERELAVLREFTDDVAIVAADGVNQNSKTRDGIPIYRLPFRRPNSNKYIRLLSSLPHWVDSVRSMKPDIISAHDIGALVIAWLASCSSSKKIHLVYDSHEFELGRNSDKSRNALLGRSIALLERFLMKRCAFSIVVNDSIADELQRTHKLKTRPLVVRNIPQFWTRDEEAVHEARRKLCELLGRDPENAFLVMYHGMVMKGRGVEQLLDAVSLTDDVVAVILGNTDNDDYLQGLKQYSETLGLSHRVVFHPAVPFSELEPYVAACDVGMVTVRAICKSYYYMLPNKFFENIQAETPIIASCFPETSRLIKKYEIGLTCDPENAQSIHNCILEMKNNVPFYELCKNHLRTAKEDLCWEKESLVLREEYKALIENMKP